MTQPSLSLLVLAWDDADSGAHPAQALPTLPVIRALAAHQSLLAVLPQLPDEVQTTDYQAEAAALAGPAPAATSPLPPAEPTPPAEVEMPATPGVLLLPTAPAADTPPSRIIGLAELGMPAENPADLGTAPELPAPALDAEPAPPTTTPELPALGLAPALLAERGPVLAYFVHASPQRAPMTLPAAPYLGSTPALLAVAGRVHGLAAPRPAAAAALGVAPTAALAPAPAAASAAASPALRPAPPIPPASDLAALAETEAAAAPFEAPLPDEPPHGRQPATGLRPLPPEPGIVATSAVDEFAQTAAELGPNEAAAIAAPEDNLTLAPAEADSRLLTQPQALPATPARASLAQALEALHRPTFAEEEPVSAIDLAAADLLPPEPASADTPPAQPLADNLHYRIIQYARFAAHVTAEQDDSFAAIYAPDWPTWLAALEIRARSRRPLVLHLSELAAATAPAAERGWRLELERYALRRAHTILVATDALRRQLLRYYGHPPGRLRVIAPHDEAGIAAILSKLRLPTTPTA